MQGLRDVTMKWNDSVWLPANIDVTRVISYNIFMQEGQDSGQFWSMIDIIYQKQDPQSRTVPLYVLVYMIYQKVCSYTEKFLYDSLAFCDDKTLDYTSTELCGADRA